jgi:hypothetical protein
VRLSSIDPDREPRVSRTYRLPLSTDRPGASGSDGDGGQIDALDPVVFRRALVDGTKAMRGVHITPPDAER